VQAPRDQALRLGAERKEAKRAAKQQLSIVQDFSSYPPIGEHYQPRSGNLGVKNCQKQSETDMPHARATAGAVGDRRVMPSLAVVQCEPPWQESAARCRDLWRQECERLCLIECVGVFYLFAATLAWQLGGLPAATLALMRPLAWAFAFALPPSRS
jgi:hypothetical protein